MFIRISDETVLSVDKIEAIQDFVPSSVSEITRSLSSIVYTANNTYESIYPKEILLDLIQNKTKSKDDTLQKILNIKKTEGYFAG